MSIYFDFDVGPSGKRFRRAVDADKYCVELFWDRQQTDFLFGDVDLGSLIELSTLSICQIDSDKNVTGIMILDDRPNIPAVDPADWEVWIRNMYQKYFLSRNTLFIHFMCCSGDVQETFFEDAVISVFKNDDYLNQIIMMVSTVCPLEQFTKYPAFKKFCIKRYRPLTRDSSYHIYLILREAFFPKLKIRRAVEEDNDDVVKLLDIKAPKLRQFYGDFYLSELVATPNSKRKIIVAEYQDHAGGVMCVNSDINYTMLQNKYNLTTIHGLRKATPFEVELQQRKNVLLHMFAESVMKGQCTPFLRLPKPAKEKDKDTTASIRSSKAGRINFRPQFVSNDSPDDISEDEISMKAGIITIPHDAVQMLESEPDELEYEIVNIDNKLISTISFTQVDKNFFYRPSTSKTRSKCSPTSLYNKRHRRRSTTYVYQGQCVEYHGPPNAFMIELYALLDNFSDIEGVNLLEGAFEVMKKYEYCIIRQPFSQPNFPLLQHFCFIPPKQQKTKYALYVAHRNSFLGGRRVRSPHYQKLRTRVIHIRDNRKGQPSPQCNGQASPWGNRLFDHGIPCASKIRVREAEILDIPQITKFLHNLDVKHTMWTVENNLLTKPDHAVYLMISGCSIIGVAIIDKKLEVVDFLRSKYNMSTYHVHKYHYKGMDYQTGFCSLVTALVYPVFEPHYRFFIREILRLADRNCMVWMTSYRNKWESDRLNTLACAMIPLLPVKTDSDVGNLLDEQKNMKEYSLSTFSMWFMSRKLTSLPRYNIDTRILLIGASRTAISFLNALIFSPSSTYLTFTDVTLLSPEGLPHLYQVNSSLTALADMMFPFFRITSDKHMRRIPYSYYANIVKGTMVKIDREKKYVVTMNGEKYHYDLLFLLLGKQYQHPNYLKEVLEHAKKVRKGQVPYTCLHNPLSQDRYESERDQWQIHYPPENVFLINSNSDAHRSLKYVKELMLFNTKYNIIVYGSSIQAYCCLATLLEMKVPPERITFVEPFPPANEKKTRIPVLCNDFVDQAVNEAIEKLNVTVYRKYYFQSWVEEYNMVTQVEFISYFRMINLHCDALFYFGKRGVDTSAYLALQESGICYNGGVLINQEFRTHDPFIYSAGTVTRYAGNVCSNRHHHKYYHTAHLGEMLGIQIRNMLDPLQSTKSSDSNEPYGSQKNSERAFDITTGKKNKIQYQEPLVLHCQLPGGFYYIHVRPPGLKTPHPYVQSLHYNGYVMETFKNGYFKLHLNPDFIVDGITCLTKEKYALENFVNLYGLPAVILNNMHIRYATKKIDDFFTFFTAPWAYWLYHPLKNELLAVIKELSPEGFPRGDTIRETLLKLADHLKITTLTEETKTKLRSEFDMSPYINEITSFVIEWLSEHQFVLPMYVQPWQVRDYDIDKNRNPLFKNKKRQLATFIKRHINDSLV